MPFVSWQLVKKVFSVQCSVFSFQDKEIADSELSIVNGPLSVVTDECRRVLKTEH